jgi:hypothetical protein
MDHLAESMTTADTLIRGTATLSVVVKERAEELMAIIDKKGGTERDSFYEFGGALREILTKKLYAALGYSSFEALLDARRTVGLTQAKKLIEVNRCYSRETAVKLGLEKAFALARYCARTKDVPDPNVYLTEGFPVDGRRRPVDRVSLQTILTATRMAVGQDKGLSATSEDARSTATRTRREVIMHMQRCGVEVRARVVFVRGSWHLRIDLPVERVGDVFPEMTRREEATRVSGVVPPLKAVGER